MATVTLRGTPNQTSGELPAVGTQAPDFSLANKDLQDMSLGDFQGKKKLISIVPSLDTPVCAISTKKFSEHAKSNPDTVVLVVSADLPFAMTRFCTSEGIDNVITLSTMRDSTFAQAYGVRLEDGPMRGLTARGVVIVDETDKVIYTELVPEIGQEPDYERALAVLG